MVRGCRPGRAYRIHINSGTSCDSEMTQGGQWDLTRGSGIPNLMCDTQQKAMTGLARDSMMDPSVAWSIGDGSASDVVGHTVVIDDGEVLSLRRACGVITKN